MYFCLLNILATLGVGVTNGLPEIVKIGRFQKGQILFIATIYIYLEEKQYISGGLFDESDQSESKQETAFR